ncbi:MAG: hypothetical protein O3B41_03830 [Bacteroidetes bacterium]|nr:hypothetical protein [Bacteroidota bacterium]
MKLHAKTIFVLVGMLLIGIALGALGQSTMHNRRMEKLSEMRRQGGLYAAIDKYIDPVDLAQEDTLRSLTKTYQSKLSIFLRHYQWHRSTLMDSLKTDMMPLLTEEQNLKLASWYERVIRKPESTGRDSTAASRSSMGSDSTRQHAELAPQDSTSSN